MKELIGHVLPYGIKKKKKATAEMEYLNPVALIKAKIVYDFGLSECN